MSALVRTRLPLAWKGGVFPFILSISFLDPLSLFRNYFYLLPSPWISFSHYLPSLPLITPSPQFSFSVILKYELDIYSPHCSFIFRFTQPEKLGMKDYSCGKCGKTHVCIGIPSLYRSLLTPSVIPKYNAILHCWFDTYTHDLLTLRHPNQLPATGSQQTAEHPKVAPGARLSAKGKSSAHPFSCNQSDVLIEPNVGPYCVLDILQRFEQKTADRSSARKIDTQIKFPASLNMAPYTSSFVRDMERENATNSHKGGGGNG